MKCEICGYETHPGDQVCINCGNTLSLNHTIITKDLINKEEMKEEKKENNTKFLIISIVLTIVIIILLVFILFLLFKR